MGHLLITDSMAGCDTENAKLTITERDQCFVVTGALPLPGRGEGGDSDRLY